MREDGFCSWQEQHWMWVARVLRRREKNGVRTLSLPTLKKLAAGLS